MFKTPQKPIIWFGLSAMSLIVTAACSLYQSDSSKCLEESAIAIYANGGDLTGFCGQTTRASVPPTSNFAYCWSLNKAELEPSGTGHYSILVDQNIYFLLVEKSVLPGQYIQCISDEMEAPPTEEFIDRNFQKFLAYNKDKAP